MILVDSYQFSGKNRGMSRYLASFIEPIARKCVLIVSGVEEPFGHRKLRITRRFLLPFWEQVVLPLICFRKSVSILISPFNTAPIFLSSRTRLILVIHDLIFMEPISNLPLSRSAYQNIGRLYRRIVAPRVACKASLIVTVSQTSRKQIIAAFGVNPDKVVVKSNSLNSSWFEQTQPRAAESREASLLCVGGDAPSKNMVRLIQAFSRFSNLHISTGAKLYIVGVSPKYSLYLLKIADSLGLCSNRIEFLQGISDTDLQLLFKKVKGVIVPSLFEGFGRPAIEALASGTPLACSNRSALPEITGGHALYFDPYSLDQMTASISEIFAECENRVATVNEGVLWARRFSQEAVAADIRSFWHGIKS